MWGWEQAPGDTDPLPHLATTCWGIREPDGSLVPLHPGAQGGLVHGVSQGLGQRGLCLRAGRGMWLRSSGTAACEVLQPPGSNPDPAPCGGSAGAAALGWEAVGAVAPRVPPPAGRSPAGSRGLSRNGQITPPSGWGSWSCMGEGLCMAPPRGRRKEKLPGVSGHKARAAAGDPPGPAHAALINLLSLAKIIKPSTSAGHPDSWRSSAGRGRRRCLRSLSPASTEPTEPAWAGRGLWRGTRGASFVPRICFPSHFVAGLRPSLRMSHGLEKPPRLSRFHQASR